MPITVTITGADPGSYVAPVLAPAVGTVETSAQMQIMTQAVCNQTQHLNHVVTDGTYTITCLDVQATTLHGNGGTIASVTGVGATNGAGVKGTGAGSGSGVSAQGGTTGAGVVGTGGTTSGIGVSGQGGPSSAGVAGTGGSGSPGVRGTGGSAGAVGVDAIGTSNAPGLTALGSGPAAGVVGTGGSSAGPGLKGVAGTGGVGIECGAGNMRFTGTQPVKTADPGFDNYLSGLNVCKAQGWVTTDGIGGVVLQDGYNSATAAISATSQIAITFARPMVSNAYAVTVTIDMAIPNDTFRCKVVSKTVNGFSISFTSTGTLTVYGVVGVPTATTVVGASYQVFGRQ